MAYTVKYWNERAAEWRGTGAGRIYDKAQAQRRMSALREASDYTVRFRLEVID